MARFEDDDYDESSIEFETEDEESEQQKLPSPQPSPKRRRVVTLPGLIIGALLPFSAKNTLNINKHAVNCVI